MKQLHAVFLGIVLSGLLLAPAAVSAQALNGSSGAALNGSSGASLNGSSGCGAGNGSFTLCDPLGNKNFCQLVKSLLDVVMAIGIPVAVFFLVWSGFRFILARGNPGELGKARDNFKYVIIGIAVFLGAWTMATIIAATIQSLGSNGSLQLCITS